MGVPHTLADKIWDAHVVVGEPGASELLYIDLHLVHEVTSPQAFEGLRLEGRRVRRPDLTLATPDHNVPTTGRDAPWPDPVVGDAGAHPRGKLPGLRRAVFRHRRPPPGHRARRRTGAGAHPARHDDRLRRQPHLHPRSFRRPRVRHRNEPGRARARHANAAGASPATAGRRDRRHARSGSDAEGRHPRRDSPDRRGRGPRSHHRVPGLGLPFDVDGGSPHGLQHVDRGGRARGSHRSGRHHLRLSRGAAVLCQKARTGSMLSRPGAISPSDPGAEFASTVALQRRGDRAVRHLGNDAGAECPRLRSHPRPERRRHRSRAGPGGAGPRLHGPATRHGYSRRFDRSSLHRLVHERAHRRPPGRGRRRGLPPRGSQRAGDDRARLGPRQGNRPRRRGWTGSSATPDSSGARRAARCVSG